jgi:hypothetical protein
VIGIRGRKRLSDHVDGNLGGCTSEYSIVGSVLIEDIGILLTQSTIVGT